MQPKKALAQLAGFALAAFIVGGCSNSAHSASMGASAGSGATSRATAAAGHATGALTTLATISVQPRKVIYKAEVTLDCENLDKASDKLLAKVKELGGYVGDANSAGARGTTREATWTVRIPAERYDELLKSLPAMGEMITSSQKSEDVSEEYYDAQVRLKNKYEEEARLSDLLKNHAGRLTDILTLEKEQTRVTEEIERIEGRIRYLRTQTDLSTVTVTLREVKEFVPQGAPTVKTQVGRALLGSIEAMRGFGVSLLVFAVVIGPWVAPLLLILWIVWRLTNRRPLRKIPVAVSDGELERN